MKQRESSRATQSAFMIGGIGTWMIRIGFGLGMIGNADRCATKRLAFAAGAALRYQVDGPALLSAG